MVNPALGFAATC